MSTSWPGAWSARAAPAQRGSCFPYGRTACFGEASGRPGKKYCQLVKSKLVNKHNIENLLPSTMEYGTSLGDGCRSCGPFGLIKVIKLVKNVKINFIFLLTLVVVGVIL